MQNPAVIVMTKVPGVADVKTRLRPILAGEQCRTLATCFLQDIVFKLDDNFKNVIVAFTPADGREHLLNILGEDAKLIEQRGNDLGERLISAIAGAFDGGFSPVIVIGTDSPTLPAEYLVAAAEYLQEHDDGVSIGPTEDGGYYLIGLSKPLSSIFENISWSSERVLDQTIAEIEKRGDMKLQILPKWYDVDKPDDLERLKAEFEENNEIKNRASRTNRWFVENPINLDRAIDLLV